MLIMFTALVDDSKTVLPQPVVELNIHEKFSVGRALENSLVIEHLQISRVHCVFEFRADAWYVCDRSSNGTKLNGISLKKCSSVGLKNGDKIGLSDFATLEFVWCDSKEQFYALRNGLISNIKPTASTVTSSNETLPASLHQQERKRSKSPDSDSPPKKMRMQGIEAVEEELVCSICSEMFVKATTLTCSHTFCQYCIREWRKGGHHMCPICRATIISLSPTIVIDNMVAKVINSLDEAEKKLRHELMEQRERLEHDQTKPITATSTSHDDNNDDEETDVIDLSDTEMWNYSSVEDEEEESDFETDYDTIFLNFIDIGPRRYGGYGRCYTCGEPGHWSPACPRRRR